MEFLFYLPGIFCLGWLICAGLKWNIRAAAENEARRIADAQEFELRVQRRIAGLIP